MPSDRRKKPHGTFTPASGVSRLLTAAGYGRSLIRNGEAFGGHRCSWDKDREQVIIRYQVADSTPDEEMTAERRSMLDLYA